MASLLFLLSAVPFALAFLDTNPLVACELTHLPTRLGSHNSENLLDSIFLHTEICSHDTIVVIDQPGLHASDLRTLPPTSHIVRSLSQARSSRQYPYVKSHLNETASYAALVSETCSSRLLPISLGERIAPLDAGEKYTIVLSMPSLDIGSDRKNNVNVYDEILSTMLDNILSPHTNHLVVYTGTSFAKRDLAARDEIALASLASRAPTVDKKAGILHRYQLLTPGLILSLLVALGALLPIVLLGISTLASIQVPAMGGAAPKGFSATEKKNQ